MPEHFRKTYAELGITIDVRYVGIHPLGIMYQWETQILEVENYPKAYFKPVNEKKPTCHEVARYIATWYESPNG